MPPTRVSAALATSFGLVVSCSLVIDLPEPIDEDNSENPASTSSDTSASATTGGTVVDPCDEDGDGWAAAGDCDGEDCLDSDPNVFPDQEKFFSTRNVAGGYDYDCNGTLEQKHPEFIECSALPLAECETVAEGFLGSTPPCGMAGAWGGCRQVEVSPLVTDCRQRVEDPEFTMPCR